jgi:Icc-related predicted phosphoesterase
MKICFISDTHEQESRFEKDFISQSDVLIHCGDITHQGSTQSIGRFIEWFSNQPATHKILIAGNHDLTLDIGKSFPYVIDDLKEQFKKNNINYLYNSELVIDGVKFYGTPIQPYFCNWAFNVNDISKREMYYEQIPEDTDVLITHSAPHNILDLTIYGDITGCVALRNRIEKIKPKISCFGHIHEAYGEIVVDGTQFINAAIWNHYNDTLNKPIYKRLKK